MEARKAASLEFAVASELYCLKLNINLFYGEMGLVGSHEATPDVTMDDETPLNRSAVDIIERVVARFPLPESQSDGSCLLLKDLLRAAGPQTEFPSLPAQLSERLLKKLG